MNSSSNDNENGELDDNKDKKINYKRTKNLNNPLMKITDLIKFHKRAVKII
jgi:hypothetical protein